MLLNEIIQGDCVEVLKSFVENSVDLILTDPPYNIGIPQLINDLRARNNSKMGKDFSHFENKIYPKMWIPDAYRVLKKGGVFISFYQDKKFDEMLIPIRENGLDIIQIGVWHKQNPLPAMRGVSFQWASELFVIARKGKNHYFNKELGQCHNVLKFPTVVSPKMRVHETQKPIFLMDTLIQRFSRKDEIVLDMFCGSGTTCLSARRNGRSYIGIEINERYVQIARKRLNKPFQRTII